MPSWEAPSTFFPYLSSSYYNFNAITYFNVRNGSCVLRNDDCIAHASVVACQHVFILYSDTCEVAALHYIVFIEDDIV